MNINVVHSFNLVIQREVPVADKQLIMEKFLPCQANSKIKHIDFRFPENRKEEFDKTVASDSTLSTSSTASKNDPIPVTSALKVNNLLCKLSVAGANTIFKNNSSIYA